MTAACLPAESMASLCIGCGACSSRCFLIDHVERMGPRALLRLASLGSEDEIRASGFLWACTLCARCTEGCPAGVRMDLVTRALRAAVTADGQAPAELVEGVRVSLETGNNSRISTQDFVETIEWLGEEIGSETGKGAVELPIDRAGSRILFVPNPREILHMPMLLTATARVLLAAGEDWTVSSRAFDITNWAYYTGDPVSTLSIARRIIDEAGRLGVSAILSTECGHGFKILREDAHSWFPAEHRFGVLSVAELLRGYLAAGRIRLDPSRHPEPVTYHDPCNLARKSGVIEEPRAVLRAAVSDYREMTPSGRQNLCCCGGGGAAQIGGQTPLRLRAGRRKADQIAATGARMVVTSCQNCFQQLADLRKEHGHVWEVRTLAQVVADALLD